MGIAPEGSRRTPFTPDSRQTVPRTAALDGVLPLAARLLVSVEFVNAALGKIFDWSGQAAYMASRGLPMIAPLLGAALVIEGLGSICLITGYRARGAAAVMFVYLGIVSLTLHNFWAMTGPAAGGNETEFFKNLGMMGGLLMIARYGPGQWSPGSRRRPSTPAGY